MTDKERPQHATVTELSDFKIAVERRFGRLERWVCALAVVVASPKVGGPDVSHLTATAVTKIFT